MSLIRIAIPVVLGLVALELLWGTATRRMVYRLADSVADFGCAAMSQVVGLAVTAVTVGGYALVAGTLAPLRRDVAATPFAWITVFLLVDLGQYLIHRLSHRVNVLWACHAVHHSSEEFNYAVGLRNSSFHGFLIWVFFLPLAVAGVPWRMVAVCYGINVLYQFWLHTRLIGRLGVLEAVLNTPSHHRVHHGTDSIYLDRNFGGVLIVWDRLFGTFRREEAEPRYGTVLPLASWNPVWANVQGFTLIRNAWRRAPDWRGRLRAVVGPPEGLGTAEPSPPPAVPSPRVALYVAAHLGLAIAGSLGVVLPAGSPAVLRLGVGAFVLITLGVLGGLLDGRQWAGPAERARLAALMVGGVLVPAETPLRLGIVLVGVVSALWLGRQGRNGLRETIADRASYSDHDPAYTPPPLSGRGDALRLRRVAGTGNAPGHLRQSWRYHGRRDHLSPGRRSLSRRGPRPWLRTGHPGRQRTAGHPLSRSRFRRARVRQARNRRLRWQLSWRRCPQQ